MNERHTKTLLRRATTALGVVALLAASACSSDTDVPSGTIGNGSGGGTPVPTCDPIGTPLAAGTAPIERGDMSFAVDPECQRVFMFHGDHAVPVMCGPAASEFQGDAYVYDLATNQWSELTITGNAPIARARGRAVWDANRKRVILFGGRHRDGTAGAYDFYNDVWAFDPATMAWTELSPQGSAEAPTGRMNSGFVADPERDRILVHGGGTTDFTSFTVDNVTHAFDLETNTWSTIGNAGALPPKRIFHMTAVDRTGSRLFVFGGGGEDAFTSTTFFSDTWYLDFATDTWVEVTGPAPEGRIKGEMIFDEARNRLVLFAGHDDTALGNNNDIWTFDLGTLTWARQVEGDTWNAPADAFCDFPSNFANVDASSPERRESHLFDVAGDTAIMYGGRTDCGLAKDTWTLDLPTLQWTQVNESPLGMTCYRSGSLQCDDPGARMCI